MERRIKEKERQKRAEGRRVWIKKREGGKISRRRGWIKEKDRRVLRVKKETVRKTQPEKDTEKMKGKIERKDRNRRTRRGKGRKEGRSEEREMKVDIEASGKD